MVELCDNKISNLVARENSSFDEIIKQKDDLISLQERDMQSLKREIVSLKQQLNCSKKIKR